MKKINYIIIFLGLFMLWTCNVHAACDATEVNTLNRLATNVKASYEIIIKEVPKEETTDNPPDNITKEEYENYVFKYKYFRIYINNIVEELYVVVTNESTDEEFIFTYDDTDNGSVYFEELVGTKLVNYTIEIYASSVTNCQDEEIYSFNLTTPMHNAFSRSMLCEGIEEFYMCHEYLSVPVDFSTFLDDVQKYRETHLNSEEPLEEPIEEESEGFLDFIFSHLIVVLVISLIVIGSGVLITFIVIKKRRSRFIWER